MAFLAQRAELIDLRLRRDVDAYAFVSMNDFILSGARACAIDDPRILQLRDSMVPYAVDWRRRRMLFTLHRSRDFAGNHAFLYQAQRAQAAQGVLLPFDALADLFPPASARPTFLFSVGRCGSTLAADLLSAVGMASVSEPGVYEQLVQGRRLSWLNRSDRVKALHGATNALCRFMGEPLVIKLRAQCTLVAQEIAGVTQGRCAMILRALEPWARSTYRAFGKWPDNRPGELAWRYAKAIRVFDALTRAGSSPHLIWYEDMLRDPTTLLQAVGADTDISEAQQRALAITYQRDSQEGLVIGRSGAAATMGVETMQEFTLQWAQLAPYRLLDRYGIADRL